MSLVSDLANLIQQDETGSGTTGVGASLNNPGAIQYADWEQAYGASQGANGFAQFPDLASGYAALQALVQKYISSGASLDSMMNAYAPVSDNNPTTPSRIQSMANTLGIDPNALLSQVSPSTSAGAGTTASSGTTSILGNILTLPETSLSTDDIAPNPVLDAVKSVLPDGLSWDRITAFLAGLICLIIGLATLKQTQILVQPIIDTAKKAGTAAVAA